MKKYSLLSLWIVFGLCLQAQVPTCAEDSSYQKARTFRIAKQYEAAFEAYQLAADEYEQAENWSCYFNCRKHQARIQRDVFKNKNQAYATLKSDLPFALEKLGKFHAETAELYTGIANTEKSLGLSELELISRIKALEIRKEVFGENSERVASSYLNIALTLRKENRLREAYNYAEAGIRLLENLNSKRFHFLANGYHILGLLARDLRRHKESITWFEKGLEARKKQGATPFYIALALQNMGIAYEYMGDIDHALDYLNQAKTFIDKEMPDDKLMKGRTNFYVGKTYKHAALLPQALHMYQKVLPVYESAYGRNSQQMTIIQNTIGEAYFLMDSIHKAYYYYREARRSLLPEQADFPDLKLAEDISSVNRLACRSVMENEAWSLLKLASTENGSPTYLYQAIQLFSFSIRLSQLGTLNYRDRADKELGSFHSHRLFEGAIEASYRLFQMTGDETFLRQAFMYSERSKASLLRESLKASAARNFVGIPDSVLHLEQQLLVQQSQGEQQIARSNDTVKIRAYKAELFQIRLQKDALQRQIESQYPAYFQLKYAQPSSDISVIQQKLKKGEWLISYFTGDQRWYGFGMSKDSLVAFQRDVDAEMQDSLIQYYQQLSNGNRVEKQANRPSEKRKLANQSLYFFQQILEPLWAQMDARPKSLVIVPDGMISHFPFELLTTDSISTDLPYSSWPFLLKDIQIRYLPAADGLISPSEPSHAPNSFAGFAPIYPKSSLQTQSIHSMVSHPKAYSPLSENQTEVSRIHELMEGHKFLAEEASEKAFWEHAASSRLLHLAMHSHVDEENPFFSALVFSPVTQDSLNPHNDGLLYAYEFYQMNLNTDLIVLSACESGYGKLLKGEGVMSLARSFQYAGAKNIVMSLWPVDDHSTSDLMMKFYQYLDQGMPKDEALRKAKLYLLENSPFRHPYYWAGFILSGDDLPIRNSTSPLYLVAFILIPILLVIGFFVKKYV